MHYRFLVALVFTQINICSAQNAYWQQKIKYVMDVNLDVQTNKIDGKQQITYTNNSPQALNKIFIHLFWNAFEPNSMMDVESRASENIIIGRDRNGKQVSDFDRRFRTRIADFTPGEYGYCRVTKFLFNGRPQEMKQHETILEVMLDKPIQPKTTVTFNTEFICQVPKLSRRSGRDNAEGIRYSMGQWYPKLSEYDYEGWHADDYIGNEFYGVWGDYDVNLSLDKNYKVGATGVLVNANEIGWGYDKEGSALKPVSGNTRTWKFSGKNIHDFVWAADPDYQHFTRQAAGGPLLHFIYKDEATKKVWNIIADTCQMIYPYMSKSFGPYPYPVYSFIQGGGGGTEYPMATLIRNPSMGAAIHEWCHSWYQMMLGTNENLYGWMDEGFTDYAEARVYAWLHKKNFFEGATEFDSYFDMAKSRFDEPMSTNANFYETNFANNTNAYYKGSVFMRQLGYITGEDKMDKILLEYYRLWRFKHPTPNDFIRVAEDVSGMQLHWYNNYFINTIKTIDYGIDSLWEENGLSNIRLRRVGEMPMPMDLHLTFKDGSTEMHIVPLNMMFGYKSDERLADKFFTGEPWMWTHRTYIVQTKRRLADLKIAEIDPTKRMADMERKNNKLGLNW